MKKMTSLLLAVVMVFALAVPAFAAVYPDQAGGNSLADMINAGNTEINGDQSLTADATLPAGTTLKSNDISNQQTLTVGNRSTLKIQGGLENIRILVDGNATLVLDKGSVIGDNVTITLTNNAKLFVDIQSDVSKLDLEDYDSNVSATVKFQKDGDSSKTVGSFFAGPRVNGVDMKNVVNSKGVATGEFEAQVAKNKEFTVTFASKGNLPTGAKLAVGDVREQSDGSYKLTISDNKTFPVNVAIGDYLVPTVNSLTFKAFTDTASASPKQNSQTLAVGAAGVEFFTFNNPDNYTPVVRIVTQNTGLNVDATTGKVIATKPLSSTDVQFGVKFAYPDGSGYTEEKFFTVKVSVSDPVEAVGSSVSMYVNQGARAFKVTVPSGYSVKASTTDSRVTVADDGYMFARSAFNADVKVKFVFTNLSDSTNTFTVEKTIRVNATNYRPSYSITVTAAKNYISVGEQLSLIVPYGERISSTSSSNPRVANVTGKGIVTGYGVGMATIYVYTENGGQGTFTVSVGAASTVVTAPSTTLGVNDSMQLSVPGDEIITASSSNTSIARVSSTGKVTGVKPGNVTIYVGTRYGRSGSIDLTITQETLKVYGDSSLRVGESTQLSVSTGYITKAVSSNSSIVSVTNYGTVRALRAGTAVVTVYIYDGRSASLTVTVRDSGSISGSKTLKVGQSTTLTVSGDRVTSAYSSDESVATVTSSGRVTAVGKGTAVVYVYTASGRSGSIVINVTASSSTTSTKRLLVDQSMQLKISGKRIVKATAENDNGVFSITSKGKITALKEGTDNALLITSDNKVYRVKIVVESREGEIDCKKNVKVALRSKASSKGKIIAKLSRGTELTIIGRSGSYFKVEVEVGNRIYTGYVSRSYVDKYI